VLQLSSAAKTGCCCLHGLQQGLITKNSISTQHLVPQLLLGACLNHALDVLDDVATARACLLPGADKMQVSRCCKHNSLLSM
jgi:hypothetical protein